MNLRGLRKNSGESQPVEVWFTVAEDKADWEVTKAAGRPQDVAWLSNNLGDIGAFDTLCEGIDIKEDMAPGKYKAVVVLSWYRSADTPDHPSEYEDELEVKSVEKCESK